MRFPLTRLAPTGAALALLAALAAPAEAQDQVGRVKVRMPWTRSMGVAGDAVEGVGLRLTNLATGAVQAATTDADGGFAFRGVAPGPYRLHLRPPGGEPLDEAISLALPRGFREGAQARGKPREIVIVGLAEPRPERAGRIPAHTPEWTDFRDSDPGVAEGGDGHEGWIELTSASLTPDGETLLLAVPVEAWDLPASGAFFDLWVGDGAVARERGALVSPPPACRRCEDLEANAVSGGIVFGDGIHGRRPPGEKAPIPVLRAAPGATRP
jgi:hypothetical protein